MNLRTNRQKATSALARAQNAETAYRAKRRATYARKDIAAAKEHFKASFVNLKDGGKCVWSAIRAGPAVIREKQVKRREDGQAKKRSLAAAVCISWAVTVVLKR